MEWSTYRRLLSYVRPYLRRLFVGLVCGLAFGATNGALIWAIRGGVRQVFDPASIGLGALIAAAAAFPVLALLRGATDYLTTYCIRWVGMRVVTDLRNQVFDHLHRLSVSYFSTSRTGELIARTTNDTEAVESAVSAIVTDVAKQPLTMVCMLVWLFIVDARLAAVSLIVFPLCLLPISAFGRRVRRYSRQSRQRIADFVSILQETLSGIRIVKAFGMEDYESRRFSAQTHAYFSRVMRLAKASAIVEPIIVVIAATGIALVLVYVRAVAMSVDDFFAFAAALFLMYEPVKKLGKIHLHVQQSSAAADRIFEVLDTPTEVDGPGGGRTLDGPLEEIRFEDVTFSYGDKPVISGVNVTVRAGERIAVVGSSGAGKTTFVNLLPRFYDPTGGRVLINGVDIRDLSLASLRRMIGLVTQETFLFNDTVANNVGYGAGETIPREAVVAACEKARAHDFIMAMPDGYETVIGERGVRLSGGQRQRMAIARAILRNPPLLILDEATSALDTESERMVQAALDTLMEGRTVFAIAHRLSTIRNCHRILVLDAGHVVEAGSHEELIARDGVYRRLYNLQFDMPFEGRS